MEKAITTPGMNTDAGSQQIIDELQVLRHTKHAATHLLDKLEKIKGIAIDTKVFIKNDYPGICSVEEMEGFVIKDTGVSASCCIYPFKNLDEGIKKARKWFCCWVAFDNEGNEKASGGFGLAHHTCRKNGLKWLLRRSLGDA
mmetsp:Transcript_49427/g.56935  ORF Transcript_49427/g.56935 Transcript_49427/m.56935 type:complete len:142 (+) Transcript_49427:6-431(+)